MIIFYGFRLGLFSGISQIMLWFHLPEQYASYSYSSRCLCLCSTNMKSHIKEDEKFFVTLFKASRSTIYKYCFQLFCHVHHTRPLLATWKIISLFFCWMWTIGKVSSSQFSYLINSCFLTDWFCYHHYCIAQQMIKMSRAVHINWSAASGWSKSYFSQFLHQ